MVEIGIAGYRVGQGINTLGKNITLSGDIEDIKYVLNNIQN